MAASRGDLKRWFEEGVEEGASHMIVVCDTFDYEDYPVFVMPNDKFWKKYDEMCRASMQSIWKSTTSRSAGLPRLRAGRITHRLASEQEPSGQMSHSSSCKTLSYCHTSNI